MKVGPALVAVLLAAVAPTLHAQTVAVRSVSPARVTLDEVSTPARVTVEGTGLELVSGAEIRVGGIATRRVEVTVGRLERGVLPLDLVVVDAGDEVAGELFLITRGGAVPLGVAVTVPAPAFLPVVLTTAQLGMAGFRASPIVTATLGLTMSGFRVAPVAVATTGLTMTGFRVPGVVVRVQTLTMTGYASGRDGME